MNDEIRKYIKEKLALVPTLPGSYQMKNKDGIIIYVGKAKKLKNIKQIFSIFIFFLFFFYVKNYLEVRVLTPSHSAGIFFLA